jgi:plasmid stabilization system protein ParE
MKGFVLSDEARSYLFEVCAFVAADNPPAADKLEQDIMQACALLAKR